jgi:hypothetical protein
MWVAVGMIGAAAVGGVVASSAAKKSAQASTAAAQTQAASQQQSLEYQQQALDYIKSKEAIPLQISQEALKRLGGIYGLPGGVGSQQQLIEQAQASPMYGAIMGGQQAGEEAIMRQAGMTGGLRSGNVQEALYDYNAQLQQQALQSAYGQQLGGLQYLSGMQPSGAGIQGAVSGIAGTMEGIGGTLAGGQIAAAQAQQSGTANLLGLGGAVYQGLGGIQGIRDIYGNITSPTAAPAATTTPYYLNPSSAGGWI